MNLNKVLLIGRLTADPDIRVIPSGQSVATFGLATNRQWTDRDGKKQEGVEFHNIVVWGRQAETTSQFLKKGSLAYIEGRLQTRSWDAKDGQKRRTTEVVAERVQFGPRSSGQGGGGVSTPSTNGGVSTGLSNSKPSASADSKKENTPVEKEELPQIDIDEDEIKSENIPF
jgi:single-strand DNA-binding protein